MFLSSAFKAFFRIKKKKSINIAQQTSVSSSSDRSKDGVSFQFKDGRRFQNELEVSYVLPNDFDEIDRIHQQHWIIRYILQCNFVAPVSEKLMEGISVLDSGCGPGTWTLEMAETFPKSKFHGVDCSCVFPENIKPANVDFAISNIAKEVPFPNNYFDYIFQRLLFLGLTGDDWDNCLNEMYRVLKPGGYIEFFEPDMENVINSGPLLKELLTTINDMMRSHKMVPEIAVQLKDRITNAGFIGQKVKIFDFNMNHTDKGGELFWDDFKQGYVGLRHVMAKINPKWEDPEAYNKYLDDIGEESKNNKCLVQFYVYTAQKPTIP